MKLNITLSALALGLVSAQAIDSAASSKAAAVVQPTPVAAMKPRLPAVDFEKTVMLYEALTIKDDRLTHLELPDPSCTDNSTVLAYIREGLADKELYPISSLYPYFVSGQKSYYYKYSAVEELKGSTKEQFLVPQVVSYVLTEAIRSLNDMFKGNSSKMYEVKDFPGQFSPDLKNNPAILVTDKVVRKSAVLFVPPEVEEHSQKKVIVTMIAVCGSKTFNKQFSLTVTDSAHLNSFAYGSLLLASLAYAIL
ncbi:hypothetical protein DSO57_1026154 [Entomophthora muscae]|uniref:Uncharacterized protein n=1 Tax=Entomophthora muscae TaxID=34485 RepID=A0ACC2UB80_9FUNG|nr:hypothetical protein DSO57_1026154 [Entomophthora muscae]